MKLVLASTSPYRRELLARLKIPFETFSPDVDETPFPDETPEQTATRLAEAKARKAGEAYPDALIIGSDQVATLDGDQIGKPHTHENATRQLRTMRGRSVVFNTALTLFNSRTGKVQNRLIPFTVSFRDLSDELIERYLAKEQPYNCAGSAKSEGLGIALIAKMEGDDPNALIGLPLIALIDMLNNESFPIL
ncbi:MAG: Maf family nucleotide pyrophosphatase [Sulfuricellaceae bacterium]|nr:Maf family nucleotide pyrophosphatase [Sulfuricellaceae bacterium]